MGDDSRSKFLLSKEALPKVELPKAVEHEKREFALPAALRQDAAAEEPPTTKAEPASQKERDAPAAKAAKAVTEGAAAQKTLPAAKAAKAEEKTTERSVPSSAKQPVEERTSALDPALDDEHESAEAPRSSGPSGYLIAAALLLLAVGVGYWWTTRDGGGKKATGKPAATPAAQTSAASASPTTDDKETALGATPSEDPADAPESPAPAADRSAAPIVAETFAATVSASPAEATVELVGTDESGPAPMTFQELDKARQYTVLVSHPGYMPKEVALGPNKPLRVVLEAKPRLVRVETIPDGAVVYVEGRRVKGKVTPLEAPVARWLLKRKKLKVAIRKPGYAKMNVWIPMAEGWLEETDAIVYNLEGKLVDAPKPVRRPPRRPPPVAADPGEDDPPAGDEPPAGDGEPSSESPAGDEPASDAPPADDDAPAGGAEPAGDDTPTNDPEEQPAAGDE